MANARRITIEFLGKDTSVGKTSDEVASKVKKTGDAAEKAGPQFDGLGDKVKGFALGTAAAFGGLAIGQLFSQALDFKAGNAKLTAELGLTKTQSATAGKVAGSLFSQNYGESMEQVQQAIGSVIQNIDGMRTANKSTLEDISMRALNTATIFDQDLGGVTRAVSQLLRTGLAKNAKEAFDIITVGFQRGADKSEDFLDTLNEYGTQFRKLGLNGKQATGLISQGLKAGARDGDLVADAIKEFSIRAVDGSTTTAAGFKAIGLNAKDMAEQIGKGGPQARKGLDTVLDRLRKMKDPVKQAAAATELFGTQSEDLGKALFALDPSKAVSGLGHVAGAADRANKALNDTPTAKMQAFFRQLQGGAIDVIGGKLIPALENIGKFYKEHKTLVQGLALTVGLLVVAMKAHAASLVIAELGMKGYLIQTKLGAAVAKAFAAVQWLVNAALDANPIGIVVVALAALAAGLIYAYKHSETFRKIVDGAFKAIGDAAKFLWTGVIRPYFHYIIDLWFAVAGALVNGAAKAFGWVPGLGPKLRKAADWFNDFKKKVNDTLDGVHDKKVKISAPGADHAIGQLKTLNNLLNVIENKKQANVNVTTPGMFHPSSTGHNARGTSNWRGGPTWLHEQGPEIVDLPSGSRVIPAGLSQRMTSGGGDIHITINGALDPVAVGRQLDQILTKYARTTGRPLNFA